MWPKYVSHQASGLREDGWCCLMSGNSGVPCGQQISESSGMQLGALSVWGRTPRFKSTRSFFPLYLPKCVSVRRRGEAICLIPD